MSLRLAVVLLLGLGLSACQTAPEIKPDAAAEKAALAQLQEFRVKGGLGVWTETESISTRVDWQQSNQDFNILVSLPAGLSSVRLIQQGDQASVQRAGAEPVAGASASRLLQEVLGLKVPVPLDQMAFWIRGLPGSSAEGVVYDEAGRLKSLAYIDADGTTWRAKILKRTRFNDLSLPATISATGGPYNVRLVMKDWSQSSGDEAVSSTGSSNKPGRLKVPGR